MDDTDTNIDETLPGDDSDIENLDNSIIANVDGDWRLPQKQTEVTKRYFVEYVNGRKTTRRKCRDCGQTKENSGNTSNLRKHTAVCKTRLLSSQNQIPFNVGKVEKRGFDTMAKLVYIDNFPITKVVNSPRLQLMYRQLNYDKPTYQSLDNYIEGKYHEAIKKIREIFTARSKSDLLCITLDKWSAIDNQKCLIVKRLIVNEYDTTDDTDAEIDEADDTNISTSFKYVIAKVRYVVKEVTSKQSLADRLRNAQNIQGNNPLKIVAGNSTRRNSFYDMLERFKTLKPSLVLLFDLDNFDWDNLDELISPLKPFKECTMDLQEHSAGAKTAVSILTHSEKRSKAYGTNGFHLI